jgi:CheY-like chemotaxis protein
MSTKRILVVDDERLTRITLTAFLLDAGYPTASVEDGHSAVALHQDRPFDVCIVDIRMPGMDGVETILALHRVSPHSRFIIYTGSPQFSPPRRLREINLSENDVVQKPVFDMRIFLDMIDGKIDD